MVKFSYTVKDINGKTKTDIADAFEQATLVDRLQKQGYFIVSIQELRDRAAAPKDTAAASAGKKFSHNNIKLDDLLIFSRQLATMLESGVTLLRSLDVIVSQVESRDLHKVLSQVKTDVVQGAPLSASLQKHPKIFNQFWVSLVEVGEASGTMPVVLAKLAFYLEQQSVFNAKVTSALIYPVILFVVCMGAISFFALFVGPRFQTIFHSMHAELPFITMALLATFDFIKRNILFFFLAGGAIFFALRKYTETYIGRLQFEKFLFKVPIMGSVFKLIIVERFASQMSILVDSGVPILYALDISQKLVDNNVCALVIEDIKEGVKQGKLIVEPMQKSGFFPVLAVQMIMVGEETGELSKMLKHVAHYYQRSVETTMDRLGTMIEPFMIIFMGAIIGVILVAMFLPLFDISKLGGG